MSKYIDADALKANINTAFWSEIEKIIDSTPSIDIVRCKDCEHMYDGIKGDGYLICHKFNYFINADDFCSYGERRRTMSDLIERDALYKAVCRLWDKSDSEDFEKGVFEIIKNAPTIEAPTWIPCSERLPEDIGPVLVTWKNNDPASYYQYIVGKHFIGTAHYHRGKWYWYSSVTEDLLAEYGKCETEEFDEAIEAVAWMPLPKPYEETEKCD